MRPVLKQTTINNNRYASLTYLVLKVLHKYRYFLQETRRLSSLTNSINLHSLCCTFASSSHPIFNYVAPAAHFKRVYGKPVT